MSGASEPTGRFVTARRMYGLLLVSSTLGAVLPLLMIVSKLSANDFHYLHLLRHALPPVDRLLVAFPLLDIERSLPFLSSWSWHAPWDHRAWAAYAPLNAIVLLLVLGYWRRLTALLERCVEWLYTGEPGRPRVMVFTCAVLLVIAYQTKAHLGFFLPGIGGWHYRDWKREMQERPPEPVTSLDRQVLRDNAFLHRGVLRTNARFLGGRHGYLSGRAMFLHFRDGEVLPANNELSDMVFPEYVFGRWDDFRRPANYLKVIRAALHRRRAGRRFLLPRDVAYPNHIPFMFVDYSTYPSADLLEHISIWRLWISIEADGRVEVVKASQTLDIDAQ